jgi:hypothetical protein
MVFAPQPDCIGMLGIMLALAIRIYWRQVLEGQGSGARGLHRDGVRPSAGLHWYAGYHACVGRSCGYHTGIGGYHACIGHADIIQASGIMLALAIRVSHGITGGKFSRAEGPAGYIAMVFAPQPDCIGMLAIMLAGHADIIQALDITPSTMIHRQ